MKTMKNARANGFVAILLKTIFSIFFATVAICVVENSSTEKLSLGLSCGEKRLSDF